MHQKEIRLNGRSAVVKHPFALKTMVIFFITENNKTIITL